MSESLDIGGAELISSKRAAELSGYAQDYIGQLARKGFIEAKRIGGLWYVSLESLNAYKSNADTYTPRPPQAKEQSTDSDSIISFDGRDYISAARAAKLTGYHPDYVGQLARSGKILSRQIGNRWYIDRDGIAAHKAEKDSLLGAVQSESTGIAISKQEKEIKPSSEPFFRYRTEGRDLIPKPSNDQIKHTDAYEPYEEAPQPISIRRSHEPVALEQFDDEYRESAPYRAPHRDKKAPKSAVIALAGACGALVIATGVFIALRHDQPGAATAPTTVPTIITTSPKRPQGVLAGISDWIERILGKELTYQRGK